MSAWELHNWKVGSTYFHLQQVEISYLLVLMVVFPARGLVSKASPEARAVKATKATAEKLKRAILFIYFVYLFCFRCWLLDFMVVRFDLENVRDWAIAFFYEIKIRMIFSSHRTIRLGPKSSTVYRSDWKLDLALIHVNDHVKEQVNHDAHARGTRIHTAPSTVWSWGKFEFLPNMYFVKATRSYSQVFSGRSRYLVDG